jgi:signal transduction histidine kinase/CheY-like chemotaxis protein
MPVERTDSMTGRAEAAFGHGDNQGSLSMLFEQSPSFMAILEGPTHRFVQANASYLRLVGNRPVLGHTVAEVLPEAIAQGYVALLDRVFETGEAYSVYGAKYVTQASGDDPVVEHFLDFDYQPLRRTDGSVTGILVEGHDVTERVLGQALHVALLRLSDEFQALSHSEDFSFTACQILGETLKVSRVGYGTIDPVAETLHVDRDWTAPGVETLAGVTPLREYGSFIDSLKQNEFININDVREDPRTSEVAAALEEKDARSFLNVPVVEKGALVAVLYVNHAERREWTDAEMAFMREVALRTRTAVERSRAALNLQESEQRLRSANETLERRVEERTAALMEIEERLRQSQKMEAIGQLTGGIAHDFNNLLTAINGSLEVVEMNLARGKLDNVDLFIGMAKDSVKRATSLTQRLLAFSRRQTLDPKLTDVNRLIGSLEDLIKRTVGPAVNVEIVRAECLWLTRVDVSQLENVLLNLCINARDAMAPAGGSLTIETANASLDENSLSRWELQPGQYISIGVTDSGCGMSEETISRIFDPFFTTKPMGQGTGLGLSMVYGFLRQSGGQVRVYSEVGRGTTFSLYLPRHLGASATEPAPALLNPRESRKLGECILVVEDEDVVRQIVVELLTEQGFVVLSAANGAEGLRILESEGKIDLLLTDVGLPGGMNGRQLADAARIAYPQLRVLFMTGYAENAVVGSEFLGPGMEVITKPFNLAALAIKVRKIIDRPGSESSH